MPDEQPVHEERRGTGDYHSPERRRCERGNFCLNVADANEKTAVISAQTKVEYRALHSRMNEMAATLVALPRAISDQMAADHAAVYRDLREGGVQVKEIFHRLEKLEKAVVVLYILIGVAMVGKGFAWLWATIARG
jgi:hypothetical protein